MREKLEQIWPFLALEVFTIPLLEEGDLRIQMNLQVTYHTVATYELMTALQEKLEPKYNVEVATDTICDISIFPAGDDWSLEEMVDLAIEAFNSRLRENSIHAD